MSLLLQLDHKGGADLFVIGCQAKHSWSRSVPSPPGMRRPPSQRMDVLGRSPGTPATLPWKISAPRHRPCRTDRRWTGELKGSAAQSRPCLSGVSAVMIRWTRTLLLLQALLSPTFPVGSRSVPGTAQLIDAALLEGASRNSQYGRETRTKDASLC